MTRLVHQGLSALVSQTCYITPLLRPLVSELDRPRQDPSSKLEIGLLLSRRIVVTKGKNTGRMIMIADCRNRRAMHDDLVGLAHSLIGSSLPCHDGDLNHANLIRCHRAARREKPIDVGQKICLIE